MFEAGRKEPAHFRHACAHLARHLQRVGAGQREDRHVRRLPAIQPGEDRERLLPQFDNAVAEIAGITRRLLETLEAGKA